MRLMAARIRRCLRIMRNAMLPFHPLRLRRKRSLHLRVLKITFLSVQFQPEHRFSWKFSLAPEFCQRHFVTWDSTASPLTGQETSARSPARISMWICARLSRKPGFFLSLKTCVQLSCIWAPLVAHPAGLKRKIYQFLGSRRACPGQNLSEMLTTFGASQTSPSGMIIKCSVQTSSTKSWLS